MATWLLTQNFPFEQLPLRGLFRVSSKALRVRTALLDAPAPRKDEAAVFLPSNGSFDTVQHKRTFSGHQSNIDQTNINQDILTQLDDQRTELKRLREENRQLKTELAAVRQGAPALSIATADPPKKSGLPGCSAASAVA